MSFFFSDDWEAGYPDILQDQIGKAGNAGQETILEGMWLDAADSYCSRGEDFSYNGFISAIETDLGSPYYDAVSIITEECAWELEELWNECMKGGATQAAQAFLRLPRVNIGAISRLFR